MCPTCKGEIAYMLKKIAFDNGIAFTNVPVIGCVNCEDETTVSFDHGLMIDHYKRNHCKKGETVDFTTIEPLYKDLNVLDILALENNHVQ